MAYIKDINSLTEYQGLIRNSPPMRLVVIDFFAVWCGPCRAIADTVKRLSEQNRHVTFAKVDVDKIQEVSRFANVTSMPTFKFFKSGQEVAEIVGADARQLEALIKQHGGEPNDKGITIQGHTDINEFIEMKQVDCLNEHPQHNIRCAFRKDDSYLESDVDEQLLISVPFSQVVKLHSVKITAANTENAPQTIKIFVNRLNLGFDDAESVESTQTLALTDEDYKEEDNAAIVPLRFVKFQNVTNISLFVQDNINDELTTQIKEIVFIGSPMEATKMENLQKVGEPGPSK